MKIGGIRQFLGACLLACGTTSSANEPLLVMLQGASSDALSDLVTSAGGQITHDLPIINAVGAKLSRSQMNAVLNSPLVARHIDDLALSEIPEEEPAEAENCRVTGAAELAFTDGGIEWTLHNKTTEPTELEHLTLTWPRALGPLESVSVGGREITASALAQAQPGSLTLQAASGSLPVKVGSTTLAITFNQAAGAAPGIQQSDFTIETSFAGGCTSSLIPGYEDNHQNFYYTQVSGAGALQTHGITGKGVTVAVLDSGLWEHAALKLDTAGKPRILARYNAITDTTGKEVFDESGHGTHMTSIIAHSGRELRAGQPTGTFKGIAPDANLVAVKAFDHEGQGDLLDIVRGIQWVVDNKATYNIRVLNLSFAARPRWPYWLDPINQAIMHAWSHGITVVAAAGNEGPEQMTVGSPGNLPYIITVGAFTDSWTADDRDDDYIPDFSSRGPTPTGHIKPDIVAPGGHMTGITRPGSSLTKDYPEYVLSSGEFVMTGSSQASALVSGIAALLLQLEPQLGPDDIKCKLLSSAEPAINNDGLLAYSPFQQGHGQVNATRAVTLGQTGCGNQELDLEQELAGIDHFEGPAIVDENGKSTLPGLETMISPQPADKGPSTSRKWGVKDHIERDEPASETTMNDEESPFDWAKVYLREKAQIEGIGSQPKK